MPLWTLKHIDFGLRRDATHEGENRRSTMPPHSPPGGVTLLGFTSYRSSSPEYRSGLLGDLEKGDYAAARRAETASRAATSNVRPALETFQRKRDLRGQEFRVIRRGGPPDEDSFPQLASFRSRG